VSWEQPPVVAQVHSLARGKRRLFSKVERHDLASIRQVGDEKSAAADVAGRGVSHCEGECGRNRRIDCVATSAQHFATGLGCVLLLSDHDMFSEALRMRRRGTSKCNCRAGEKAEARHRCRARDELGFERRRTFWRPAIVND
jgi:hypothetical protein